MVLAFAALVLATLSRTLLIAIYPAITIQAYVVSAGLWAFSFVIFTAVYYPILTKPR